MSNNLQQVAALLVGRAQRQGFIQPGEIREELALANLSESLLEEAVALAGPALVCHKGRYYPVNGQPTSDPRQKKIERTLQRLIRSYRATTQEERRQQNRVHFVHAVEVLTEDGRELTLLTRDLSLTGIRLISSRSLLGEKLQVLLPSFDDGPPYRFLVRVVWVSAVGDDLFEIGGMFLDLFPRDESLLRLAREE